MPGPTEHHRDERVLWGPIFTPFSYAHTDAYNQAEFTFIQIAFLTCLHPRKQNTLRQSKQAP